MVNNVAAANLGQSSQELIDKSIFDNFSKEIAQKYLEINHQLLETGDGGNIRIAFNFPRAYEIS